MKKIFSYTFQSDGNTSSLNIFADKVNQVNDFQKQEFKGALLPPFNKFWEMSLHVRALLTEIPPQEITIKVSGEPFVFYYFFRMLSWLPQGHSFNLESNFRNGSPENFLIQKMNDYVLSLESNFKQLPFMPFPTDYIMCKECLGKENIGVKSDRKFQSTGIDIVIPTKNVPYSQIEECLVSVLPQLEENDVIFLVDDNETDSEICKRIVEKFPSIILIEGSHRGIGSTRNIGAKVGSNPLIAFIDSDDCILSGFLELQRKFHHRYLDIAATGTWIQSFGAYEMVYPQWDGISPISLLACLPPAGVLMWKREAIASMLYFREDFTDGFEDFDLVSRAVANQLKIFVLDLPLYRYRRGNVSLSQSWTKSRENELQIQVERNLQFLCSHEFKEYIKLNKIYGNKLLLSHPDLVFGLTANKQFSLYPYFPGFRIMVSLIQRFRNVIWLRRLWHRLDAKLIKMILKFLFRYEIIQQRDKTKNLTIWRAIKQMRRFVVLWKRRKARKSL